MKLSWMRFGRDTKELTKSEATKGAVETVAENTADGIIAPMLYMFIGGAPLAFLYKGINTMDSMVGYKNDKYLYFGRCAAKLEAILRLLQRRCQKRPGQSQTAPRFWPATTCPSCAASCAPCWR